MEATVWNQFELTVYSIVSGLGLFGQVVMLIPMIQYCTANLNKPFYIICVSLCFCDICNLLTQITSQITDPLLYMDDNKNLIRWKGFTGNFFWYGTSFHQLLIAIERSLVILFPAGNKLILNKTKIIFGLFTIWTINLLCNFCILTDLCPYMWYPNTTTVFYDYSVFGASLHNKIVDFGIQGTVICITVMLYTMAGIKVKMVRKKIQIKSSISQKKTRLENLLLLQSVYISIPHTVVIIVYHAMFFIPYLSFTSMKVMNFVCKVIGLLGYGLNPMLHLVMNKDLRYKIAEAYCTRNLLDGIDAAAGTIPLQTVTDRRKDTQYGAKVIKSKLFTHQLSPIND